MRFECMELAFEKVEKALRFGPKAFQRPAMKSAALGNAPQESRNGDRQQGVGYALA